MIEDIIHGLLRIISEAISGFITATIISVLISANVIPATFLYFFEVINLLSVILLILTIPHWGSFYILGWLVGYWIMLGTGLAGGFFTLLSIVAVITLLFRIRKIF